MLDELKVFAFYSFRFRTGPGSSPAIPRCSCEGASERTAEEETWSCQQWGTSHTYCGKGFMMGRKGLVQSILPCSVVYAWAAWRCYVVLEGAVRKKIWGGISVAPESGLWTLRSGSMKQRNHLGLVTKQFCAGGFPLVRRGG